MLRRLCVGLVVLLAWSPGAAVAEERIERFDSDITINTDGSLDVTETIAVIAEGRDIRRGIYRDFPTIYRDRFGNRIRVGFEVFDVRRDGAPEAWTEEPLRNGVRVRIGRADRFLDRGPHEYEIRYRTSRQLGFFAEFDELYWNVTGNGWGFKIDEATATVTLPAGGRVRQAIAYTGPEGERGMDFAIGKRDGVRQFRTTRQLQPREGLTIAVAWQKGVVAEPTTVDRVRWFLQDNFASGVAMLGTLLVFTYYFLVWRRFGRDPAGTPIFPRFKPPEGLSPAATRFIRMMTFDRKAFSAALIQMGVKGYLKIEEEDDTYRLRRRANADLATLSNGERRIAKQLLLTEETLLLDHDNHRELRDSIRKLRESLAVEFEKAYFQRNTVYFVPGLCLSIAVLLLVAWAGGHPGALFAGIALAVLSSVVLFAVMHFWGEDDDPTFKVLPFRALPSSRVATFVLQIAFFVLFSGISSAGAATLQWFASPAQTLSIGLIGTLNVLFFYLLKRPTLAGRALMDEIEGFRMYLGVAEAERLNRLNPPDKTPELFEKYLPYAIALDVENEWAEQFTAVLAAASATGRDGGYRPDWYDGDSWSVRRSGSFSDNLGSRLGTAVAASVSPPGSSSGSSGSGGGGSSGGGGGGGGGGGW